MVFFSDEDKNEIIKNNNTGFCIILDIKDSTKRKKTINNWELHTKSIYNAFVKFTNYLTQDCDKCNNKCKLESQCPKEIDKIMCKFTGDGGVSFLLSKTKNIGPLSWCILHNIYQFINEINDKELNELLEFLNIKFVVTYLTGIYLYEADNNFKDVIGRGMDFSFRIEKYSAPTHIVINRLFYNNIEEYLKNNDLNILNFISIECKKNIKGWDPAQPFYLITNDALFYNAIETIVPSDDGDIYIELLKKFVKTNKTKIEDENLNMD